MAAASRDEASAHEGSVPVPQRRAAPPRTQRWASVAGWLPYVAFALTLVTVILHAGFSGAEHAQAFAGSGSRQDSVTSSELQARPSGPCCAEPADFELGADEGCQATPLYALGALSEGDYLVELFGSSGPPGSLAVHIGDTRRSRGSRLTRGPPSAGRGT